MKKKRFQSTLPARGSDRPTEGRQAFLLNFNPRSPRGGATDTTPDRDRASDHFNPRSPRGGATNYTFLKCKEDYISIHAPREGERQFAKFVRTVFTQFQSTLPARGSDSFAFSRSRRIQYFNPRSPRGGATNGNVISDTYATISIHAPREGERPSGRLLWSDAQPISIHAPREGERQHSFIIFFYTFNFNPRSPRGGATVFCQFARVELEISIHAPREGERLCPTCAFNPS